MEAYDKLVEAFERFYNLSAAGIEELECSEGSKLHLRNDYQRHLSTFIAGFRYAHGLFIPQGGTQDESSSMAPNCS